MGDCTARHNRVILSLGSRIASHLHGTGCQVFTKTMKVQIADGILYPDVLVTCGKAQAGDEQITTDPKLIIEVLSASTRGYDRRDKLVVYRSLLTLREYVLIDPAERRVEVFTLAGEDAWTLVDQTKTGTPSLDSIELQMPMQDVFKGVERAA
jgi:Uma2 family endonuclease